MNSRARNRHRERRRSVAAGSQQTVRSGPDRLCHSGFRIFLAFVRDRLFPGGLGNVVLALAHRNYRIYAAGNAVSLVGIWMQRVAVGWLAWTLTHSGTWLGIMSMAEFFPVVFF